MCDGGITTALAIGSALAAAGGTAYSTIASNKAAGVEANSQAQMVQNQNNAFMARNTAAQNLAASTGQIQSQGINEQQAAADAMRTRQDQALSGQEQQIQQVNQQASQNDQTGQSLGQTLAGATTAPALAAAQTADAAARAGAVAPTVENIQTSNPLSTSAATGDSAGDSAVQQATLKRMAEAATSVRDYASRAATIGSYSAPSFAVGQAVQANQTGLLPAQLSDQLLKSGEGTKLLPFQTEYGNATNIGATGQQDIQSATAGQQQGANLAYGNVVDTSGLSQADKDQLAQNQANTAAAQAKIQQSLGSLISTAGNLGLTAAGYYGNKGATYGPNGNTTPLNLHTGGT